MTPSQSPLRDPQFDALLDLAFAEDFPAGDVTTEACVDLDRRAKAQVVVKGPCVLAGTRAFLRVFERLDARVEVALHFHDGAALSQGDVAMEISGPARSLLTAERVALNFLMHLSGVATLTRTMVEALADPHTDIVCTRKTTPGLRNLEKQAVRAGGGRNHRFSLSDGVMIKENHIVAAGGIGRAVERARARHHHLMRIEVETTNLDEVGQALDAGADAILLDNMNDALLKNAIARVRQRQGDGPRIILEASGNMSAERLPKLRGLGLDLISIGALTHSAPAADLSMQLSLG